MSISEPINIGGGGGSISDEQKKLQRELADKITHRAGIHEIRILIASGALPNESVVQGLRPLHYAVYANELHIVRLLLARGADIDARDECGYTALHICAEHGNYGLLEFLISEGARVCFSNHEYKDDPVISASPTSHLPSSDESCDEPLRLSIRNDHFDCAELLLQNGADANAAYFLGHEINFLSPTDTAAIRLLLLYGADPNAYDREGCTLLMKSAKHRDSFDAIKLLIEYGANINGLAMERQDFRTPLHFAILTNNEIAVKYLLAKGAHANMFPDYVKPAPLDLAVLRDNIRIVELLLRYRADPNAAYTLIGTPIHMACISESTNQYAILKALLDNRGDPNACPVIQGTTLKSPMAEYFRSQSTHNIRIVRLLLSYGAELVMQPSTSNPKGILRALTKIDKDDDELFDLVLDAGQQYSLQAAERLLSLSSKRRIQLLHRATQTPTLAQTVRNATRQILHPLNPEKILCLPITRVAKDFLLFA